jgi:diguanylate cyclase (GGDEF)-like protein
VARRLCAYIAGTPVETHQGPVAVTASIGVAALGGADGEPSLRALLQRADMAMYEAKRSGRNRVCVRP